METIIGFLVPLGFVFGPFWVDLESILERFGVVFNPFPNHSGTSFDFFQLRFRSLLGCMFALLLVLCAFGDEPKDEHILAWRPARIWGAARGG